MGVQLILYPQVYDGYYSWTAYGNNSTGTATNPITNNGGSTTGPGPVQTPIQATQILGNSSLSGQAFGAAVTIPTGSPGIYANNLQALINQPAPVGKWRLSNTNNLVGNEPELTVGKLYLTTAPTESTSIAYTTVTGLQAGNAYRVLVDIESGPVGKLKIGNNGPGTWQEQVKMNGTPNARQLGGPNGVENNGTSWINARTGMTIGDPLVAAITEPARFYINFTATGPVEVLQLNFLATNASSTPLIIQNISLVSSPTAPGNVGQVTTNATAGGNNVPATAAAAFGGWNFDTAQQTFLDDGQVILDLYKDESIPLNLSADDFTSVDEKIASYSKSFMIPATKHNNKIFSFYFDVTRSQDHDIFMFNPFCKTKAKIKDDTVLVFEGWMKLINVQEKDGQISYNINVFSEPTTFCDYLKASTIGQLDFDELGHDYNAQNIEDSWDETLGIELSNPLPVGSYAGAPGATRTNVMKYPFINWTGAFELTSLTNFAINQPENVFRPVLNCKYLIDKFFEATPYTYDSAFLNSAYFSKLFMDFNFGGESGSLSSTFSMNNDQLVGSVSSGTANPGPWITFVMPSIQLDNPAGTAWAHYDQLTGIIKIPSSNSYLMGTGQVRFKKTHFNTRGEWRLQHKVFNTGVTHTRRQAGITWNNTINQWSLFPLEGCWTEQNSPAIIDPVAEPKSAQCAAGYQANSWTYEACDVNDEFWYEFRKTSGNGEFTISTNEDVGTANWTPESWKEIFNNAEKNTQTFLITGGTATTNFLMQGLRGQMSQYDFWAGIKKMFNLVTIADKQTEGNFIIEPYADIFLDNPKSKILDWTNKLDASSIKQEPLNKLPQKTIFTYIKDPSDYRLKVYTNAVAPPPGEMGGYLYGMKTYAAGQQFFSLLAGTKKIECKPFAPTIAAPLSMLWPDFIISHIYKANDDATEFSAFDNKPRILYDNGLQQMPPGIDYSVSFTFGFATQTYATYGQMTHLSTVPTSGATIDLNFGECPLVNPVGSGGLSTNGLFNTYWKPYYDAIYNPDCRVVKFKALLTPKDINEMEFWDTVLIKNREYKINKIQYSAGLLASVELILIP
tara:strand:+ start:20955 stop:24173 length:3219 start_codon:yes stop_codon:yes gene_type:complete